MGSVIIRAFIELYLNVSAHLNSWLAHGVFPESITLVSAITAAILAAEQGVKSIIATVQAQGNMAQDIAWVRAMRKIIRGYLDKLGYKDVIVPGVNVSQMQISPQPQHKEIALVMINYNAMIAGLAGAEVCSVSTIDEAIGVPTEDAHEVTYKSVNWTLEVVRQQHFVPASNVIDVEQKLTEVETRAIMDRILDIGDGDPAIGYVRGVEAGVVDSPISSNVHVKSDVIGVRDIDGAARYLEFGNLPIPEDVKELHREKVAEREKAEGRKIDYTVAIKDFWAPGKGSLISVNPQPV